MPDATEWLVEYIDQDAERAYEHFATLDEVEARVRSLFDNGFREVYVYQRVPHRVLIDVTVTARRRRKKEAKEGAAGPVAQDGNAALVGQDHLTAASAGNGIALPSPASPVFPWTCEARFEGDPVCPGFVELDPVTKGHFCGLHIQIPESHRREFHNRNASRNRPVRVAHAG